MLLARTEVAAARVGGSISVVGGFVEDGPQPGLAFSDAIKFIDVPLPR